MHLSRARGINQQGEVRVTGEEFKAALKALGWRQADLYRRLELNKNTTSGWATHGAPTWVAEYLRALLGIKALHDAIVAPAPRDSQSCDAADQDGPAAPTRAQVRAAELNAAASK